MDYFPLQGADREPKKYSSTKKAVADVDEFLKQKHTLKVGDFIVRNKFGEAKYKFPNGNQVAKIIKIFNEYTSNQENNIFNAYMCVAVGPGDVRVYEIDTRYFKKAPDYNNNIINLWRKK